MRVVTLTLPALCVIGTSAAAQWGLYSVDNRGFFLGGGDDVIEGFPAFLAWCVQLGGLCYNIDDASIISFKNPVANTWTFTQSANGISATVSLNGWNGAGGEKVWLTPTVD
ncbi:hypothetical protein F5Y08DRAFT_344076 [Xylaria arbuscula]|nr:hypothetical protein F5Y08DRAFT_344076 [Xylaria arbuscula]